MELRVIKGGAAANTKTKDKHVRHKRVMSTVPEVAYAQYKKTYPALNSRFLKSNKRMFELCMLHLRIKELNLGFKIVEVGKTWLLGTTLHYEAIHGPLDHDACIDEVIDMINQFNTDYGENLKYDDI